MKLSNLEKLGVAVRRDCAFMRMGVLSAANGKPGSLVFCESEHWLREALKNPNVAALLVPEALAPLVPEPYGIAVSDCPRDDFYRIHNRFDEIAPVVLHEPTRMGRNCTVSPLAYIDPENVVLGDNVVVKEFATVYGPAEIGDNTVIRAGVRIGSDGFQFPKDKDGKICYTRHYGGVTIGTDVEIKENTVVNKGLFFGDRASIGDNTKIDAQCYIAHNVSIGARCLMGPGVQVCGSSTIGDRVWIGPQALISSELKIGDEAQIVMGSIVIGNVKAGKKVSGNFAVDHEKHLRNCIR